MHFLVQDSVKLQMSGNGHQPGEDRSLPGEHVGNHLNFGLRGSNLLCRGHFGLAAEEEGHVVDELGGREMVDLGIFRLAWLFQTVLGTHSKYGQGVSVVLELVMSG